MDAEKHRQFAERLVRNQQRVFRYVVSHDDGLTWTKQVEFLNPGRPIGGRACPRLVQVDDATLGILYYDVAKEQEGGPGVFFLRMPLEKFAAK